MKYFNVICFLLCIVFACGCGTQESSSNSTTSQVEMKQVYIYQQDGYEKVDMKDEVAVKVKEAVSKILKENSSSLEVVDGSMIWGKAEEEKKIKEEECYIEVVFSEKEKIKVADALSYDNITAMLVNVKEGVIYLSQKENVLESGDFGIGLDVPDELMEQYFDGI